MSQHSRNWLKFIVLVTLAFVLGLFFAGLLNFPRQSFAQNSDRDNSTPIAPVEPPRIPSARPLADLSEAFAAVSEAVRPSVVFIDAQRPATRGGRPGQNQPPSLPFFNQDPDQPRNTGIIRSTGTGFIVSADGYILTNHHVIQGASNITVQLLDGRVLPAEVVGSSSLTDVGVLRIDATGLKPAALGSSSNTRVGEWVLAIGNPLGGSLTFTVTQGIISAKGRGLPEAAATLNLGIIDFLQTDAAINQGNSGGPLVNVRGEVIGINSVIATGTGQFQGYAFAIPIDLAKAVMTQIINTGRVERTGLGVMVRDVTPDDAAYLDLDSIAGVKIDQFSNADSPARQAGLEIGDVIIAADGTPVTYVAQLQQLVGFRRQGDEVRIEVARGPGGKRREFTVRLIAVDPEQQPRNPEPVLPSEDELAKSNRLGLGVEPVTAENARDLGLPLSTRGLLVRDIAMFAPAGERLCPVTIRGCIDVITAVEGKPVRTEVDLRTATSAAGHNGIVSLEVVSPDRNGAIRTRVERVRLISP